MKSISGTARYIREDLDSLLQADDAYYVGDLASVRDAVLLPEPSPPFLLETELLRVDAVAENLDGRTEPGPAAYR